MAVKTVKPTSKLESKSGVQTLGRRKSSVARVFVRPAAGEEGVIMINGLDYNAYLGRPTSSMVVEQPLVLTESMKKYDIIVNVSGGGKSGQAGAIRLGIARALQEVIEGTRPALKKAGYLTRDPREVERKKYGRHKARKRPQFSKR